MSKILEILGNFLANKWGRLLVYPLALVGIISIGSQFFGGNTELIKTLSALVLETQECPVIETVDCPVCPEIEPITEPSKE